MFVTSEDELREGKNCLLSFLSPDVFLSNLLFYRKFKKKNTQNESGKNFIYLFFCAFAENTVDSMHRYYVRKVIQIIEIIYNSS